MWLEILELLTQTLCCRISIYSSLSFLGACNTFSNIIVKVTRQKHSQTIILLSGLTFHPHSTMMIMLAVKMKEENRPSVGARILRVLQDPENLVYYKQRVNP